MGEGSSAADGVDLTPTERADIDGMYLRVATSSYYELLGVPRTADRRAIRDAYFALSKRFHPDAFFGKNLGAWKTRLELSFRELTRAYEVLGNRNARADYDAQLGAEGAPESPRPTSQVVAAAPDVRGASPVDPATKTSSAAAAESSPPSSAPQSEPARPTRDAASNGPVTRASATRPAVSPTQHPAASTPAHPSATDAARAGRSPSQPATGMRDATQAGAAPDHARAPGAGAPREAAIPSNVTRSAAPRSATSASSASQPVVPPPIAQSRPLVPTAPRPPSSQEGGTGSYSALDPDAARRAAREALARKLGGPPRPPSGAMPAATPPGPMGSGPPPRPADTMQRSSTLQSLEHTRTSRMLAERRAKVQSLTTQAEDALRTNNLAHASNLMAMAVSIAPDDLALKARADEVTQKHAATMVEGCIEQARFDERSGDYASAAANWQRAALGRPNDAGLHERAAAALARAGTDMRKAAELARRATQLDPGSPRGFITLAQIFMAAGLRASAIGALETASKLDPTSPVVKDLLLKARR